jgi:uncharacterized Fe-S cluster-containing radical SAM superfamily protein
MINLYLEIPAERRAEVVDLSGGQPDLVPEWCYDVMRALDAVGLRGAVRVWIDDNLSGNFVRRYLSRAQIEYMAAHPGHTRVGCFKGFDSDSFAMNTKAAPAAFDTQFKVMRSLIEDGFDMYAYATFTCPATSDPREGVPRFMDRLQALHPNLPLRTIPLEIRAYSAAKSRVGGPMDDMLNRQILAAEAWDEELLRRFTAEELALDLDDVELKA